ncbi:MULTISPECIES: hypothetical protein [unclassified Rhizobium]|uniref:hypothetical protein n=1 Tax=unclassified Rhizobium TaxID=2613769 RepID=UPI001607B1CB|nr:MULTISPECIES: hypothetical protein [unclassified Rhizobium]MBB3543234.1 hypothetical protein [Rhizobium sp. BK399]MCS3741754.1 hypothetical protein [Rhizobium sp. BK661]MCS4093519.1 hypothetical protein [Rhizobium sp. BK176]
MGITPWAAHRRMRASGPVFAKIRAVAGVVITRMTAAVARRHFYSLGENFPVVLTTANRLSIETR